MTAPQRHLDTGKLLIAYADEVLVRCVGCDAPRTVHASWVPYRWTARYDCGQCNIALDSREGRWLGPVRASGRRPCGQCGYRWLVPPAENIKASATLPAQIGVACPQCARVSQVAVTYAKTYPADACCYPHFGLPLRLVTTTRHGTVWAYNRRHLAELTAYIAATLRLRRNAGNRSMVSRLPTWMKLAKHRDEVGRALERLERIV